MLHILLSALEMAGVYAPLVVGVYLTFRILHFPDLTVDGSFTLGGALTAIIIVQWGQHPGLSIPLAFFGGCVAGLLTGSIYIVLGLDRILSGLIVMLSLYSVNLAIMGAPNLSLLGKVTLLENFVFMGYTPPALLVLGLFLLVVLVAVGLFLHTEIGLCIRATGKNESLLAALGIRTYWTHLLGLAISNGLAALAGALMAQLQGFADIQMGFGSIIVGLAGLVLGQALLSPITIPRQIFGCLLGILIYEIAVSLALLVGLPAIYLKLCTACVVVAAMAVSKHLTLRYARA